MLTTGLADTATGITEALFTDLYELTMLQSYWREGMTGTGVFSLYYRTLPSTRNYMIAAGLDAALDYLECLHFSDEDIAYLGTLGRFQPGFLAWLKGLHFTGHVRAIAEGTPVFPEEPILEIEAPLPEAQLVETFLINQINLGTLIATKAARMVDAAAGRPVLDFGSRRAHGVDAGLKAARSAYLAGCVATSNVMAGKLYGLPLSGTMAHSYVAASEDEHAAFRAFLDLYPETVLLVDTYDPLVGVDTAIRVAKERPEARIAAIRFDSGDLAVLATEGRRRLDAAGLGRVQIVVTGGLDEHAIARLVRSGAPIDGFGVGTSLVTSSDAAQVDMSYKLSRYAGRDRVKMSTGKRHLPGPKQVFRRERDGVMAGDAIVAAGEAREGRALLKPVMQDGRRLPASNRSLEAIRRDAVAMRGALPPAIRSLEPTRAAYPVAIDPALIASGEAIARRAETPR